MTPQQEHELLQEIAQMRRENRRLHRWVIFIGISVGTAVFAPRLAAFTAARLADLFDSVAGNGFDFLAPIAAIFIVVAGAAAILSHRYAAQPKSPEPSEDA